MREPDFKGPCGRAWRVAPATPEMLAATPDYAATLGLWLLNVPGAHPMWHSYVLGVIHLRAIPGVRAPVKHYPEAEYELLLAALDPREKVPDPDDIVNYKPSMLQPMNLVEQFHGVTDEQARTIGELLVRAFVDGHASPDTDYRSSTQALLRNTIEHFALGAHPRGDA